MNLEKITKTHPHLYICVRPQLLQVWPGTTLHYSPRYQLYESHSQGRLFSDVERELFLEHCIKIGVGIALHRLTNSSYKANRNKSLWGSLLEAEVRIVDSILDPIVDKAGANAAAGDAEDDDHEDAFAPECGFELEGGPQPAAAAMPFRAPVSSTTPITEVVPASESPIKREPTIFSKLLKKDRAPSATIDISDSHILVKKRKADDDTHGLPPRKKKIWFDDGGEGDFLRYTEEGWDAVLARGGSIVAFLCCTHRLVSHQRSSFPFQNVQ